VLRFPSTNIKLAFQSLVDEKCIEENNNCSNNNTAKEILRNQAHKMAPLKVNIPDPSEPDFTSPIPSPTGTIRFISFYLSLSFSFSFSTSLICLFISNI